MIERISSIIAPITFFYLTFSFVALDFDVANWDHAILHSEFFRFLLIACSSLVSFIWNLNINAKKDV